MQSTFTHSAAVMIVMAVACPASLAGPPLFEHLNDLPGGASGSYAWAISGDGSVVVGESLSANGTEAFRWSRGEGLEPLGGLQPGVGGFFSKAAAVSRDGSVIAGTAVSSSYEAFRWTRQGGIQGLGFLPGDPGGDSSTAAGISADGLVIIGDAHPRFVPASIGPMRWTAQTGMTFISEISAGMNAAWAAATCADGSVIVGTRSPGGTSRGFIWRASGITEIPGLSPLGSTIARGISGDGRTVVGEAASGSGMHAICWTAASGTHDLGDLPGGYDRSVALAASGDGTVIVGRAAGLLEDEAFIWTAEDGLTPLKSVLIERGTRYLEAWRLTEATSVSEDGRIIVGNGFNPQGVPEAWIVEMTCPADFDGSGFVDTDDFGAFVHAFEAGC